MNDVMKKRLIGVAVLVIIGVLAPLLLSRCMHGGNENDGRGSMRVYNVQPNGETAPVDGSNNDRSGARNNQSASSGGDAAASGIGQDRNRAPKPDAVSPQSESDFSTPPIHGNSAPAGSSGAASAPAANSNPPGDSASSSDSSAPANEANESGSSSAAQDHGAASSGSGASNSASAGSSSAGAEKTGIEGWVVQVASFSKRDNAKDMTDQLESRFPVSYAPGQVNGKTYYRVYVGPFDSEQAAQSAADRLSEAGHKGLVRHLP
ncbi:SPOR domain-containing protein [Salinisphaera sp.]|uniref:SPOR domain-containing protein n=1 Tax=Salinisphaera sp. TaxID=1914330 RepID=UPI002D782CD9|nr:SPOR domain-containing protein [Salinisphaera sp.]HET7314383.1 SPOR domain-containing protein [Salinisphaera sp.]